MIACTTATGLTILYYTLTILEEIWQGPVGKAFQDWFSKTHALPPGPKKISLLKIN